MAILYADVSGYSRLTAIDEDRAHALLSESLDIFAALIGAWRGSVMHYAGDAVLANFATASDALSCALLVQRKLALRNDRQAPQTRMAFRIGINVGEVIEARGDVYGTGVNVAARLEALAEPGGICVSEAARAAAADRLAVEYQDLGDCEVKNIPDPVRAWRVVPAAHAATAVGDVTVLRAEARSFGVIMDTDSARARRCLDRARSCVESEIERAGGRITETPGETVVAWFGERHAGLVCARSAREALRSLNERIPVDERVHFRFGIDVGEFAEGDDGPRGAAVSKSASLASAAATDAILVSGAVLGDRNAEDIALCEEDVYVVGAAPAPTPVPPQVQSLDLPTPQRPSLALMPLTSPENNPETEALAVGIRMDVQNGLVRLTGLFLIAAGTTAALSHLPLNEAAERMGVRYLLEGNVLRSGARVRVNVQLNDALEGTVVWSERYDRVLDDAFAIQDEISDHIVTALDVQLASGEQSRLWRQCLKRSDARHALYRGFHAFWQMNPESMATALRRFERCAALAPEAPIGGTMAAMALWFQALRGWTDDVAGTRRRAGEWAARVADLEDVDGQAHTVLGNILLMDGRYDEALETARRAAEIRPGCTNANGFLANVLLYCGIPEEALDRAHRAIRLSPVYPPWFVEILASGYRDTGQTSLAIAAAREAIRIAPASLHARAILISALVRSGWLAEAQRVAEELRDRDDAFTVGRFAASQPYRSRDTLDRIAGELAEAGLPV